MFIQFDPKTMHIQVICGVAEVYKPNTEINEISKQVDDLKAKMNKFMNEVVEPGISDIQEKVKDINERYIKTE